MEPHFEGEVRYYAKHELLKRLPITYQALLNFKRHSEGKISEQLASSMLDSDEIAKDMIVVNPSTMLQRVLQPKGPRCIKEASIR